jgi:small GTP-binding protein
MAEANSPRPTINKPVSTDAIRALSPRGSALQATSSTDVRILMLGLPGAGKTTLLTRISKGDRAVHDMGNQKFKVRSLKTDAIDLLVWDVGEGVYVDEYWADFHSDRVVGLIFVVDATNSKTLGESKRELFKLLDNDKLQGMPLAIFVNKSDVEGAQSVVKVAEGLELHEVRRREFKAFKVSAVTDEGIQTGLEWIVSQKWTRT